MVIWLRKSSLTSRPSVSPIRNIIPLISGFSKNSLSKTSVKKVHFFWKFDPTFCLIRELLNMTSVVMNILS